MKNIIKILVFVVFCGAILISREMSQRKTVSGSEAILLNQNKFRETTEITESGDSLDRKRSHRRRRIIRKPRKGRDTK